MSCHIRITSRQMSHINESLTTVIVGLEQALKANEQLAGDHPMAIKQRARMQKRLDSLRATREYLNVQWDLAHRPLP